MSQIPTQNIFDRNFKPEIPSSEKMITFGLDILSNSSIGIELIDFIRENDIKIRVIRGPEEKFYVSDKKEAVIVLKSADPAQPSRFILLLTGAIRDVMQEYEGLETPDFDPDVESVLEQVRKKRGDRVGYMCAIAYEINQIESFSDYHIIDELKDLGYSEHWNYFKERLSLYNKT